MSVYDKRLGNSTLRITYRNASPETATIVPRLRLDLDVQHTSPVVPTNLILSFGKTELKILSKKESVYIYAGTLISNKPYYNLSAPLSSMPFSLYADLDHYKLAQIEKIREGGDAQLQLELSYMAEILKHPAPPARILCEEIFTLEVRISKSDWIERFLPQFRFKEVALIEIPKIENPEFSGIVERINDAWKQYSMGDYNKVLTECRKAIDGLTRLIKDRGFEREIADKNGKKKIVPDWENALRSKDMGDLMDAIIPKHYGFLSPSAHYGKSINREDAELALMVTLGIVNFISKRLAVKGQEE